MNNIEFQKMNEKKRSLYEGMWGSSDFDYPVEKTIYRGAPTDNSYTFADAYIKDKDAGEDIQEDYCRDRLADIFGIVDTELFKDKFHMSIGGSGQELKRIATVHSSSLCALLFFYGVSENNPYELNIAGKDYVFTESYFEYQNTVIEGRNPSNMDVVLVGSEKETGVKTVFFIESKFSEYYERPGKQLGIATEYLNDKYGKAVYRSGCFEKMGIRIEEKAGEPEFSIETDNSCYLEGIKQMISHFIGVVKLCENPTSKDDAIANAVASGAKVILGEILFTDRIGDLPVNRNEKCFASYRGKYQILSEELNKQVEKVNMNDRVEVLSDILSYDIFKDAKCIKEDRIKRFYFEMGRSMKVILSRKGFDSANGGIVSPVFPDGRMLSFPIPSKDIEKDSIRYSDLCFGDIEVYDLLKNLGYNFEKNSEYCHLDPDLDKSRRKVEIKEWKAAFGQINQAAGYLNNQDVKEGDLFLFFGNFRHIKMINGVYRFARRSKDATTDYYGKPFQAIWGYMQVGRKITDPNEIMEYKWHPHACKKRNEPNGLDKNNTLYVPSEKLSFRPDLPGYGLFEFDERRVLTMKGKNKATWKYNSAYDVDVTTRKNCAIDGVGIYYSGIWQELVLDNAESWAESLF